MGKKTVSFLVSGRGSNFTAVAEKIINGDIDADPGIVISDNVEAKALITAKDLGMKSYFVDPKIYPSRREHEKEMIKLLLEAKTDLVVAAGYMRLLTSHIINSFRNKIINIHPALLPAFPGTDSQKQAFDYGVKITGCTTHFINEGVDTGPVIMQSAVTIENNDSISSLSLKILEEEHRILPMSVKLFCENKLKVLGNKVIIKN